MPQRHSHRTMSLRGVPRDDVAISDFGFFLDCHGLAPSQ